VADYIELENLKEIRRLNNTLSARLRSARRPGPLGIPKVILAPRYGF
jgi:hypothetical protein